jgi:flagellar biosynthesis GTPase FlhF
MSRVQRLSVALLGLTLIPFTAVAQRGRQTREPVDPNVPTAIEQALMDHVCRATNAVAGAEADVYQACLAAQLTILRADFGRDLSKLSAGDRRRMDAACSRIRNDQGRDAYVACLNDQLAALRARRKGAARPTDTAPPTGPLAAPSPADSAPSDTAAPLPPPVASSSRSTRGLWAAAVGMATVILTAGVLLVRRNRKTARVCHTCGKKFSETGGLCPTCRHEAADALRHAAAERASQERAQEEAALRLQEQEEARRQLQARQAEEARQQQEERARQQEEARREDERQREELARQRRQASAAGAQAEDTFDPYAILGLQKDASADAIQTAYQAARTKYDLANVEFLGPELQDLYRTKGAAVERAFKMLTS